MKYFLPALLFQFVSCTSNKENLSTYISRFEKNKANLNQLIPLLKIDSTYYKKQGPVYKPEEFKATIRKKLIDLGIIDVYPFSWGKKQRQFALTTNWGKSLPIELYYNSLDTLRTKQKFYIKDKYGNQVKGLGGSWAITSTLRYLPAKQ